MPLDLLHFGSGVQAVHYFVLCFVSILGTLQCAAVHSDSRGLIFLPGRLGYVLGGLMIVGAFAWFFWVDEEIFTPGLAGGELFILFILAFALAFPIARIIHFLISVAVTARDFGKTEHRMKEPI